MEQSNRIDCHLNWPTALRSKLFLFLMIPLLWALAYLPQLGARDLRLEEGRRAEPAAEMLRTGDWITPRLYGEPYLNKPPLFFWLAATLGKIQGEVNELSIRIPSVISALLGAWLVAGFARKDLPREIRAAAGLILLSMPIMLDKGTLGEIDALLSLETFASIVILWAAYDPDRGRIAIWAWLLSGVLMGIGALTKGPGGAIEFYGILIPFLFLLGKQRWKLLLSPGHFLMILVALVPVLIWAAMMLSQAHIGLRQLAGTWMNQLDFDALPGMKHPPGDSTSHPVQHYETFALSAFAMLLPWSILYVFAALPRFGRQFAAEKKRQNLWLLLAVSGPALLLLFWAWPGANPRYMMMVAYPVSVLAAWFAATPNPKWTRSWPILRSASLVLAILLAIGSIAAIIAATKIYPPGLAQTLLIAALSFLIAAFIFRLTLHTPINQSPLALACSLAILIMLARGLASSIFLPAKAPTDATRILHDQIVKIIPSQTPIYTTRTLAGGKGNNYFNAQFYFPNGATALNDFTTLPLNQTVTVILTPEEWPALQALAPSARELGRLQAPNGPPPLIAAEVTR